MREINKALSIAPIEEIPFSALDEELSLLPMNDLGNAQRWLRRYRSDFIYVRHVGWHYWDGTHWAVDEGESMARRAAHSMVELIGRRNLIAESRHG